MKRQRAVSMVITLGSIFVFGVALAAQDRYMLKSPNGIAFSEMRGYERWQMIASSQSDRGIGCSTSPDPGCIKSILGNPVMIDASIPGNLMPFAGVADAKQRAGSLPI